MFTIREATLDDVEGTARVHTLSWQTSYRGMLPDAVLDGLDPEERATKRRARIKRQAGLFLLGCEADTGEIIGFCDAGAHRETGDILGEVYAIYLLEAAKRRGIGRALLEYTLVWLRERSLFPVIVWALENNPPARAFYEAMGGKLEAKKDLVISGHACVEVAYVWR